MVLRKSNVRAGSSVVIFNSFSPLPAGEGVRRTGEGEIKILPSP
jgi:hypothetical protein